MAVAASSGPLRLGVLTSHPIQYQAPLFRALAELCELHVYFAHRATPADQAEAEFGVEFDWDVDLTGGYRHRFLRNVAAAPGITRFAGCDTPDISRHLAAGGHDAFLVCGWHLKSYLQAARACRKLGVPVMTRTDSHLDTPRSPLKRTLKALVYPWFLRRFDAFLPTGIRSAAYLRHYRAPAGRIYTVPYCIDVDRFRERARRALPERANIRAGWGVEEGELALLFAGKLTAGKRPADLLDAVRLLRADGIPARAVYVGAGPLETELRERAAAGGVPACFAGFRNQSEMPACYAAADLLALPSASETWGLAINEAFACGLPAVVSDAVGGAPDLIEDGLTGATHAPGDPAGLADAIRRMHGRRNAPEVTAALAAKTVQYSPARSAAAVLAAARGLIGGI